MDEAIKVVASLLLLAALVMLLVAILMWLWQRTPQDAGKHLDKTLEAGQVEFGRPVHAWLEAHIVRYQRWTVVCAMTSIWACSWIAAWHPSSTTFVAVLIGLVVASAGCSIGAALLTLRRKPINRSAQRVAALRQRTVWNYIAPWEAVIFLLVPVSGLAFTVLIVQSRSDSGADVGGLVVLLGAVLLSLCVAVGVLQRYLVWLPQHASDEEEQLACDLLVSIAIRDLFGGVLMPVLVLFQIAWGSAFESAGDLPPAAYVVGGIAVLLVACEWFTPSLIRHQARLWRFRQFDQPQRVPA